MKLIEIIKKMATDFQELLAELLGDKPKVPTVKATPKSTTKVRPDSPSFPILMTNLLQREGGFVNDAADRGGATKYGITRATLSNWLGKPATVTDVKRLTKAKASDIYRKKFYLEPKINRLPADVQEKVFDMAVNHGPQRAVKMLQRVVGATEDGDIGPQTLKKVNQALAGEGASVLMTELVDERNRFFDQIVKNDPSQKRFYKGWINRSEKFRPKTNNT